MELKKLSSEKGFKCEYCGSAFVKEKTLSVHVCEQKRRHLQVNEKQVQLGFQAFNKFYKLGTGCKTPKTYNEFCKSQYYNSFVKFGSFLCNVKPLYPEKYVDHVIESGIKLDDWCSDQLYENYALEFIKKENAEIALDRTVRTMVEWSEEHPPAQWNEYFNVISTNQAVWHIRDGKISPWLLLNCTSGQHLLSRFNDEQLTMVFKVLDPDHWTEKFKRHPADLNLVRDIVHQVGL